VATAQSAQARFEDTATAIARDLDASARDHKRQERAHREAAQRDRQRLERLLALCQDAGVRIVIERTA